MFRLRIDSPFIRPLIRELGFSDEQQRRRIILTSRRLVQNRTEPFIIEEPKTVHEILTAWSGKLTDEEVSAAVHLDEDDDLDEIARDNDIAPPSPPAWATRPEPIVDR